LRAAGEQFGVEGVVAYYTIQNALPSSQMSR
jgi:hypothetical protein